MQQFNFLGSQPIDQKANPGDIVPGRLRLATIPSLTGSPPIANTIGIVVGTIGLALQPTLYPCCDKYVYSVADQIRSKLWQLIEMAFAKRALIDTFSLSTKPVSLKP